jgi:2-keto-3-deoxy-L-rhamnonate aldolase RhmA
MKSLNLITTKDTKDTKVRTSSKSGSGLIVSVLCVLCGEGRLYTASALITAVFTLAASWPQAVQQTPGRAAPKLRINTIIEALEQGRVAESGVNWTFVDMEHGPYLLDQLRLRFDEMSKKRKPNGQLESTPVVRIPMYGEESPSWAVKQVLDLGALSIVFPQIETRDQAVRAIRSMRFPPQRGTKYPNPPGIRGSGGGSRALWGKLGPDEYFQRADVWPLNPEGELFAVIMIETPLAIKNINQILDVPGVGAIFIGAKRPEHLARRRTSARQHARARSRDRHPDGAESV